ncbi:MAG: hypothetical protein RIC56_15930 [Pseudomonadales bacterium]
MQQDLDIAISRWKEAGPLSEESLRLLIELRKAGLTDQPKELLWAAFVRSLTDEQRSAALAMIDLVNDGEAFRLF